MAVEPVGGFLAGGDSTGQHDLESPLAEFHFNWCAVLYVLDRDACR